MEGRRPNGLAVVLVNCSDPDQEVDFDRWYNEVHLPDVCDPGVFPRATRFENPQAQGGENQPRHIAIYETDRDDPGAAWDDNRENTMSLRDQGRIHPTLKAVFVGVYKRWGGPNILSGRQTTGILVVLNGPSDLAREDEFNAWYDEVHIPDVVSTGAYHSAVRYVNTNKDTGQPKYLAIYETDASEPLGQLAVLQDRMKEIRAERIDCIQSGLMMPYGMTYSTVSGEVSVRT